MGVGWGFRGGEQDRNAYFPNRNLEAGFPRRPPWGVVGEGQRGVCPIGGGARRVPRDTGCTN